MAKRKRAVSPTRWWYLAALLGGVLIGALGYLGIKDDDPDMANRVLAVSLIPTIIGIVIVILALSAT